VRATSSSPQELLNGINAAIRAGKIVTWQLDSDEDITHSPEQWKNKAWFRPVVEPGVLVFKILGRKGSRMSKEAYAVYHGRLIEMLLEHFDLKVSDVSATALPVAGEVVSGR
jgi:hypothetical protein